MPLYRTRPDVSLDDLIAHLEWVGEEVISTNREDEEWVVVTKPPRARSRPFTDISAKETR